MRLARAIISDIVLYHESEIASASPNINGAVDEGRALFQQRVEPTLHALFEQAISESRLAPWGAPLREAGYRDVRPSVPRAAPPAPEPPQTSVLIPVGLLLTSIALAVYYYFHWYR
jgi:hypothetical protein